MSNFTTPPGDEQTETDRVVSHGNGVGEPVPRPKDITIR
jgi:hypothetical protein